jgi:hypothetical protein
MWYFALRMILITALALLGLKFIFVGAWGAAFTGYAMLGVASLFLLIEIIGAVEQIMNAYTFNEDDDDGHDPY